MKRTQPPDSHDARTKKPLQFLNCSIRGIFLLAGLLAVGRAVHAAEPLVCTFESGADGFGGQGTVGKGKGDNITACLRVENTSNDWESVTRLIANAQHDLRKLSFRIHPEKMEKITVRFTDATGQIFQEMYDLTENEWQTIEITDLTAGQSWGGANDKVWHEPCGRLDFLNEEKGGVALIDDVTFVFKDEPSPAAAEFRRRLDAAGPVDLATFDADLDDFDSDSCERRTDAPAEGAGYARLSNKAEDFVETVRRPGLQHDFLQFSFRVRSRGAQRIGVRFQDATGQEFMTRYPVSPDNQWNQIVIRRFGEGEQSWGGADDKKWHAPCKAIAFVLEEKGKEVDLDSVRAWLHTGTILSDLSWNMAAPSNVFLTDEAVRIPFETRGDTVEFRVTDFWGKETQNTAVKPQDGKGELKPATKNGYFLVRARAMKNGTQLAEKYTCYGVIPPFEVKDAAASPWGVATHFAQGMTPKMIPTLKKAGIGMIRDELYWDDVEKEKGKHEFSPRFVNYMEAVRNADMAPLIIMSFANPLHDDGKTPWTDAGCNAFADYGNAIRARFGSDIRWLEVWNEYNGTWCEGPAAEDRPRSYVKLLKHAYERIKTGNPDTQVLGCAPVLLPRPYMEGIFQNGGLPYMDGVVIHPYRARPEGVDDEVEELRALMRKYSNGKEKDIWVTETGLAIEKEYDWEKGRNMHEHARFEAARYLPRQYALLLKAGCKRIFWYVCADSDLFKTMGLLRQETDVAGMGSLAVTPNYIAYATLIRQLDGKPFRAREGFTPCSRAYCLRFGKDEAPTGGDVRVIWGARPSAFDLHATGPLTVTDIMGGVITIAPENGKVRIPSDLDAVYVLGPVGNVEEVDTGSVCIAATYEDFSDVQGQKSWEYGFRKTISGEFQRMVWKKTEWDYRWVAEGYSFLHQSREGGEPEGTAKEPYYMDRRWTSTVGGELTLTGELGSWDDKSDGLDFHVLVDGKEVFAKTVAGGEILPCSVTLNVKIGSKVDILVGPNKETCYDSAMCNLRLIKKS